MGMARDTMIWVVDDDPELRKMVGTYLIDQGYDVRSLCDVKQFEARLECQRPDLVVLDLMLPGDDGFCLLYTSPSPRDKRQSRMPSSA